MREWGLAGHPPGCWWDRIRLCSVRVGPRWGHARLRRHDVGGFGTRTGDRGGAEWTPPGGAVDSAVSPREHCMAVRPCTSRGRTGVRGELRWTAGRPGWALLPAHVDTAAGPCGYCGVAVAGSRWDDVGTVSGT